MYAVGVLMSHDEGPNNVRTDEGTHVCSRSSHVPRVDAAGVRMQRAQLRLPRSRSLSRYPTYYSTKAFFGKYSANTGQGRQGVKQHPLPLFDIFGSFLAFKELYPGRS